MKHLQEVRRSMVGCVCLMCEKGFLAKKGRKTCSSKCRMRLSRARRKKEGIMNAYAFLNVLEREQKKSSVKWMSMGGSIRMKKGDGETFCPITWLAWRLHPIQCEMKGVYSAVNVREAAEILELGNISLLVEAIDFRGVRPLEGVKAEPEKMMQMRSKLFRVLEPFESYTLARVDASESEEVPF